MCRTFGAVRACALIAGLVAGHVSASAQQTAAPAAHGAPVSALSTLKWRSVGPNRGGRSIAVAGSAARPLEYYFGATGGGLWKTTDGGIRWI
nr:hypothetical protein [Acidobacteriota bacterium]